MAWVEKRGQQFRIVFRFGGKKCQVALKTNDEKEAGTCLTRFEENLRLVERGRLVVPANVDDIGVFLLSDGKLNGKPGAVIGSSVTLSELFADYRKNHPKSAKEASTLYTESIHLRRLERIINGSIPVMSITPKTLQAYIDARARDDNGYGGTIGSTTIKKEIGTFTTVWNQWGVPQGIVAGPAPTAGLLFAKERARPPFQTRAQIERQLARSNRNEDDSELWECMFLTLPEVEDVLSIVKDRKGPAYAFPMFAFAAHTGARRSEILRSLVTDFDFEAKVVLIREKKKDSSKEMTFRSVPITAKLETVMKDWFARHPGGPFSVCTSSGRQISVQLAAKTFDRMLKNSKWSVMPGWHCFRHSFISNCVAKGIDQRMIDFWVGHTTEEMRRRYSHLIPRTSQEALCKVFGT